MNVIKVRIKKTLKKKANVGCEDKLNRQLTTYSVNFPIWYRKSISGDMIRLVIELESML